MKYIDEADAMARLEGLFEEAQRQTVVITRRGQDMAVIVSVGTYERLRKGNVDAFLHARNEVAAEAAQHGLYEDELGRLLRDDA